jgi:hypothetical protein
MHLVVVIARVVIAGKAFYFVCAVEMKTDWKVALSSEESQAQRWQLSLT